MRQRVCVNKRDRNNETKRMCANKRETERMCVNKRKTGF